MEPIWTLLSGYEKITAEAVCRANPLLCNSIHPIKSQATRTQRFLGAVWALPGFAAIGMAIRNGVRLTELFDAMEVLSHNQDKISSFINSSYQQNKFELHKMEALVLSRAEESRQMIDLLHVG